ncbi:hypothetical protein K2173_008405 [Erythroxylum novogranatense]|uniref:Gamma-interferon-inducible lysosomal thiol reductase n=1 Tax=Erythroxylum novogranatense TaxID=1862640 RepID=A0AAV8UCE2_9ROSI|nr:hypothetical protein K2173_008405 [Erythroxylum novogranatense]
MASFSGLRPCLTFLLCTSMVAFSLIPSSTSENVTLSLYYETLCPYCANFIVNHLVKLFDKGLFSIVNLRLIPWGNAFLNSDGSFVCQHGPNECFFNAIEACTIQTYPDVMQHFRIIHCIERLSLEDKLTNWVSCFGMNEMAKQPIGCYTNGHGNELEKKYSDETAQLNPAHRFVPWVVVNNHPLQEDYENFASYICKAYKGTQVPEACRSLPLENESLEKDDQISIHQVCYAEKPTSLA